MRRFELPRNLLESLDMPYPDRDALEAWIGDLPRLLAESEARWSIRVARPFQPGGVASYVAPARTASGAPVVLKLGWLHEESLHERDALVRWNGDGAVRLIDAAQDGRTSSLLLEACRPGTRLADSSLTPAEQDVVLADLVARLWVDPGDGHPFRPLAEMCACWADRFEQRAAVDGLDLGLARAGVSLFRELPRSATRAALLCTDIHPANILAARREPWLAIDPKPYVGDPAYDTLQHMLNFPERLRADPVAFSARLAGLLALDASRVRQWLLARCVIESPDRRELADVARRLAASVG